MRLTDLILIALLALVLYKLGFSLEWISFAIEAVKAQVDQITTLF